MKTQLKQQIQKIDKMDKQQLIQYSQSVDANKHILNKTVYSYLTRAIDIHMMRLMDNTTMSAMVVMSDIKDMKWAN